MTMTIDNMIINALQYCKEGLISITLSKQFDGIKFSISDEGIGIPENELIDIFETSVVSSLTKTPAGGRGFGLALCKKVMELHKGEIWARCNDKKGVTFSFILPLARE